MGFKDVIKKKLPSPSWVKKIVPLTPSLLFKTATPFAIVCWPFVICKKTFISRDNKWLYNKLKMLNRQGTDMETQKHNPS